MLDARGKPVAGQGKVGREEGSWSFRREKAGKREAYSIAVDEKLEDLAGNTQERVFDLDRQAPLLTTAPQVAISFPPL